MFSQLQNYFPLFPKGAQFTPSVLFFLMFYSTGTVVVIIVLGEVRGKTTGATDLGRSVKNEKNKEKSFASALQFRNKMSRMSMPALF